MILKIDLGPIEHVFPLLRFDSCYKAPTCVFTLLKRVTHIDHVEDTSVFDAKELFLTDRWDEKERCPRHGIRFQVDCSIYLQIQLLGEK